MVKKKLKLSPKERARRRRQALLNFGKKKKTKRRTSTMVKKRRIKRRSSSSVKPMPILFAGGAYGAIRERVSMLLAPLTSKIPLGSVGDEIGLFFVANEVRKRFKPLKKVGLAAMYIESARIGEALASGEVFGNLGVANNNNAVGAFKVTTF